VLTHLDDGAFGAALAVPLDAQAVRRERLEAGPAGFTMEFVMAAVANAGSDLAPFVGSDHA